MFISIDIIYFFVTIICGVAYGYHCHRTGVRVGAQNTIEYLEDMKYIIVDDETGEISRVSDRQYRK